MKTVLVSGGSKGLGKEIVEFLLTKRDYNVCTFSRSSSEFIRDIENKYRDRFYFGLADLSDFDSIKSFLKQVKLRFSYIDILINNAAIAIDGLLATMSQDDSNKVIDINLKGTIYLTKLCSRDMIVRNWGRIVNISSIVGIRGYRGLSIYSATKAAIDGFTRSLARELGERNITVNSISPGFLETEMTHGLGDSQRNQIIRRTPLGRLGKPSDVIPFVDLIISENASFITGQTIVVDGGISI